MNIRDAVTYRKMQGKRPTDIVVAFEQREAINEVILYDRWRLRLVKEITREEFMIQLQYHKTRDDRTTASTEVIGARVDIENAKDLQEPSPKMKYFYAAEIV